MVGKGLLRQRLDRAIAQLYVRVRRDGRARRSALAVPSGPPEECSRTRKPQGSAS